MMSDDSDENLQFIIQDSKKSWGYTSAAKKLRATGSVHEKKGRGKQEDAYTVQKDMEIQEAHRLLTEAGVGDQEMDENEREQLLVALRNSLKNTEVAQTNKDEDEVLMKKVEVDEMLIFSTTSDSEIPPETHVRKSEKAASSTSRLRRDQRGKTEATSKVRVENLPKRERKRKYRRNITESEEEVEVSSSSDTGDWKGSSEASNSKIYRSPLQVTDEHRQRAINMLSKQMSQKLTPIKEKSECEETSEALFITGKENLSGKTVSWDNEKKHETVTASEDEVDLTDMGDSVVDTTERVAGAESDRAGLPHLHEIKVPVTDEEQSNQEMPYIVARPYEPQHKTEESTQKGATLSLYQEEEESSDADKKPLPHDDIFCWCNTKSCKQLKRRYRRKQLSWEKNTYFCPSSLSNPSNYSKVILKLFNLYFAQYTNYQKTFFQNMLSWGSSVTVGHHCSGTLTAKKRGDPSLGFDESDDKHAFSPSPTFGSDPRKNVQAEHHALNKQKQLGKKDGTGKFSQRAHSLCSTHTLETEDTQPYDSDDELPDVTFPLTQRLVENDNQGMEPQQDSKDQLEVQTVKNEKSSISSESLGFIFCEDSGECPHLSSSSDLKLAMLRKQQQNSSHKKSKREHENLQISKQFSPAEALEQKEIKRKRKQNNPMEEDVCSLSDEEFEILFLQKKKHFGAKKRQGEVCATGQKRPVSTKCTKDNSGQQMKMALSEGSLSLSSFHSQDSSELRRRAESDKVMELASLDKEGKKGHFEGPDEQAENDVYIPKIAYRDPSSTRQRRNLTHKGYRQNKEVTKTEQVIPDAEGPNTKHFEAEGEEQSEVQCPMCFKSFPNDVVEEHAYICQGSESAGDISDDRPHQRVFPQRSKTSDLLLMPLTRQPIHDSDNRGVTTCAICETQVSGQRAYQQHYKICLKRTLPSQQRLVKGGQLWREQNEFDVSMSRHVALRDNPETSKDMSQDMAEDSDSDLHSDDATNDPNFIPSIKQ